MNLIRPVGLKEGKDKEARVAFLRRQLMEEISRREDSPTPAQRGEASRDEDPGTPVAAGLAAARSASPFSSSSSCSSERCGSGDSMNVAARRKRSALARVVSLRSSTPSATASGDGNYVEEDLSAKMSRMHSPMKTESEDAAVLPVVLAAPSQPKARSLLFSASTVDQDSVHISSRAASHSTNPQQVLVPYQAARSTAQYPLMQPVGNEAGTGTEMALVQSTETRMVLHDPKGIKLGSGKTLTGDQYAFIKKQQRTTQNFWDSKWAFPTGDIHERGSLLRALDFVCWGMHRACMAAQWAIVDLYLPPQGCPGRA